jgi:hypothetical protein
MINTLLSNTNPPKKIKISTSNTSSQHQCSKILFSLKISPFPIYPSFLLEQVSTTETKNIANSTPSHSYGRERKRDSFIFHAFCMEKSAADVPNLSVPVICEGTMKNTAQYLQL